MSDLFPVLNEAGLLPPTLPISIMTMHQRHGSTEGQICRDCAEHILLTIRKDGGRMMGCALYSLAKSRDAQILKSHPACGKFSARPAEAPDVAGN